VPIFRHGIVIVVSFNSRQIEMMLFHRRGYFATLLILPVFLVDPADSFAQQAVNQEFAEARSLIESERQQIIREELALTGSEAAAFWPLYQKYRSDIERVRVRQDKMITTYLKAYNDADLSEGLAKDMLDEHLEIKSDLLQVQKKYLRQFRRVLRELTVARFYHLENKLDAEIDIALADVIPLFEAS
jgi:hypothetical protein